MYDNQNVKFNIRFDKRTDDMWSFGIGFSHFVKETYLWINLYKWQITIGFLYNYDEYVDYF